MKLIYSIIILLAGCATYTPVSYPIGYQYPVYNPYLRYQYPAYNYQVYPYYYGGFGGHHHHH